MVVAIHQPNYLPRLRVFSKMAAADLWVFLDSVQHVKREWQSRALLPSHAGSQWLTVPLRTKGRFFQKIQDVESDISPDWQRKHLRTLRPVYGRAPFIGEQASKRPRSRIENFQVEEAPDDLPPSARGTRPATLLMLRFLPWRRM